MTRSSNELKLSQRKSRNNAETMPNSLRLGNCGDSTFIISTQVKKKKTYLPQGKLDEQNCVK